jgi:hypothetical protein
LLQFIELKLIQDELGSLGRCQFRQFNRFIAALPIDFGHVLIRSIRFAEVLLAFAIRLIDLLPRRSQKNECCIPVLAARALDVASLTQADEARVAEGIWYPAVGE